MGIGTSAMTMAILLKLTDQMSGPLKDATGSAKRDLDALSDTARKIGQIKVFEQLNTDLDALSKALVEAKRKRDFFMESANGNEAGAKAFGVDIRDAKEEVLNLARAIEEKKKSIESMGESLRDAGVGTTELKDKLAQLESQLAKETKLKQLSSDLEALAEKARQVGERFEAFGRNATAFGLTLGAGVQQAVSAFATLEEASARLKSTLMTDKGVSGNFEAINNLAIELGNRLPGTTADFAGMMAKLLQLGVTEEAILGGVGKAAANLAVVMKLPYEQAAEIAAKLKEATGTAEADMLKFMDTIQRVGHQGVQSGEMMYAFARSAGALKQFGIQGVEQANKMASVYAQLIKSGASGETVGTGMSSVLNRALMFDNQSTKSAMNAADTLKELGIQIDFFDDKTGQFKGVDNMIAQFDKLKGLNQSQMGDVLNDMFGSGQDAQFVALLAQGGVKANQGMQKSMAGQADINARVNVQLETLSAKWEAATGTFENLLAKIGETMAPQLGKVVDWFNEISAAAQSLVENNKELFGWLGLGLAGAAGGLVVAGGMAMAIGSTLKIIGDLMLALKGLSAFLLANPMVLTILGVAAAGAAGYAFGNYIGLDDAGKKLGSALYDVVQSLKKGWTTIKATLSDWKKLGSDIIDGLWQGIQATMRKPLEAIGDLAKKLPQWAKDLLGIKSPSRVFAVIGEQIGEGMAVGMISKVDSVHQAAKKLGVSAIYGMKDELGAKWLKGQLLDYAALEADLKGDAKKAADAAAAVLEQITKDGQRLTDSLRSEMEKVTDSLADYDRLLAAGAITWDTYARAVFGAVEAIDKIGDKPINKKEQRNQEIGDKYAAGASLADLSKEFGLSEEWIKKLVARTNEADTVFGKLRMTMENAFKGMEDALVSFVKTGKLDFRSLADSIVTDLIRIQVQELMTQSIRPMLNAAGSAAMSFFGFAQGGAPGGPGSTLGAWRNQIVDRPTFFAFAQGGVMGEAGPEAIMPLSRGPDGTLGVRAQGTGAVTVNIINNASGAQATQSTRSDGKGNQVIDVFIEQIKGAIAGDIARGNGAIPAALGRTYGLNPTPGMY